ncbi:MAG: hypothetical protein A2W85_13470 [Bacteroidetes bacterium GWF2_41_31]|nr:MAG: hypothetical protein A2W85_13470 [Bacteroidetes bacterium GWF2_41_31]
MFFFYRWILQFIFGKVNNQILSFAFFKQILSVLKQIVITLFRFVGWVIKQFFQLIVWITKTILVILKGLFRIFIYNPRR